MTAASQAYVGRFAPSPTGPLHQGSLIAALASYLDAKAHSGLWLLRIEDLDPAREPPEASEAIINCLERLGLHWDQDILFQSTRLSRYHELSQHLVETGQAYYCDCSRTAIRGRSQSENPTSNYDGHCRHRRLGSGGEVALRVKVPDGCEIRFADRIQGNQSQQLAQEVGDFVIFRRDGLFAYQLAVVADDAEQGVTDVVRGSDLLDSTGRQRFLQDCLQLPSPRYAHIPVIVNSSGQKLSKQTFAAAIDIKHGHLAVYAALEGLGQQPPAELKGAACKELLDWGIKNWSLDRVPRRLEFSHTASASP